MEFSVDRDSLLKELSLTQGVVERKTTIPILANLLIEAVESTVRISATDLELAVSSSFPAKVKQTGSGTIPAKRLLEIARTLPAADIRFKLLENHWVQLNCQRSSFKLVGMARDNFPALPAVPKTIATLPCRVLTGMINRTIFSISNEESRYTLNGALLVLKPESVAMVATDGHRLSLVEGDVEVGGLKNELHVLIPKKAMGELVKLLAEAGEEATVEFSKDENHLYFSVGGRLLVSRVLTGQFPNYDAVLPRENKRVVELDKDQFTAAVRRVALLADERSRAIKVQLDSGKLEVYSSSGDYGEANEAIEVKYTDSPMQIGFNYQYLLDFLGVIGEGGSVRMELKDEQSAGQLRPADEKIFRYRYIVMPMRI